MPVIPAQLVVAPASLTREQVQARLLAGQTLLNDSVDHLLEVVAVLESYGEVLDAYSKNLIYQAEQQFLNPLPSSNTSMVI
ncbi:MAG: CO2 hydration protein, partial [Vulcanococcus sp.]